MSTRFLRSILFASACAVAAASPAQSIYQPFIVTTFAGGANGSVDGVGTNARFSSPSGTAVDASGNLFVADTGNATLRKITPDGVVTTFAGAAGMFGSADGTGGAARFDALIGLAVDNAGNLYVGDSGNHTIRKVTPAGVVTTLAGLAGVSGSADGSGSAARFRGPRGVAVDAAGNVYVADTFNDTIRKITPAGLVSTLAGLPGATGSSDGVGSAARFSRPRGVAVDVASNVFVADTANNLIRRITPNGVVSTLAGMAGTGGSADGTGNAARFSAPIGIAAGAAGEVYVADSDNQTIRKITSAGAVTTLAGEPLDSGRADGAGRHARFSSPQSVAVADGRLFVGDTGNNTIRKAEPASQPLNIATRARVGTDQNAMIGGFIVTGDDAKRVLVRAIGPSLQQAGISGALADPVVELRAADGSLVRMNDDWQDDAAQAALIRATGIPPTAAQESALVATLPPSNYTAVVTGKNRTSGIGLVEIYDLDPSGNSALANISTRGFVETGDGVMIGGFILGGDSGGAQVLVRALGPSLAQGGIIGALANPTLELRNSNGDLTAANDDWRTTQQAEIEATGVPPSQDVESAVMASLPPGNYTTIVAGKNGAAGVGLVEVYNLR